MIQLEVAAIRLCQSGESSSDEERKHRVDWMHRRQYIESLGYQIGIFDRQRVYLERVYYIKFDTAQEAALFKLTYL